MDLATWLLQQLLALRVPYSYDRTPPQILRGAKKFKLELFFDLAPFNVCRIQTLSRRAIIPRGLIGFMRPQGFTLPHSEGAKVRHVHFPALEF